MSVPLPEGPPPSPPPSVTPFPTPAVMALARARWRAAPSDSVAFTAGCPACGSPARWVEQREETRLRIAIDCDCEPDGAAAAAEPGLSGP